LREGWVTGEINKIEQGRQCWAILKSIVAISETHIQFVSATIVSGKERLGAHDLPP
jgi:hypothetical protein